MWIVVTGGVSTGKKLVVDHFLREGFEHLHEEVKPGDSPFETEAHYMLSRAKLQVQASRSRERKDIITTRTVFDSRDIFIPRAFDSTILSERDYNLLKLMSEIYDDNAFQPPHAVVMMTTPLRAQMDLAKLKGRELMDTDAIYQQAAYKKFQERIRVPVIEIDASKRADLISQDISFYMNSLKSSALGGGSVWQKTFFKEG